MGNFSFSFFPIEPEGTSLAGDDSTRKEKKTKKTVRIFLSNKLLLVMGTIFFFT